MSSFKGSVTLTHLEKKWKVITLKFVFKNANIQFGEKVLTECYFTNFDTMIQSVRLKKHCTQIICKVPNFSNIKFAVFLERLHFHVKVYFVSCLSTYLACRHVSEKFRIFFRFKLKYWELRKRNRCQSRNDNYSYITKILKKVWNTSCTYFVINVI